MEITSKLEKAALISFVYFLGLLSIAARAVIVAPENETFSHNPYITIPMALAGLAGTLALVFGFLAFFKSKKLLSFLIIIASLLGVGLGGYIAGELFGLNF